MKYINKHNLKLVETYRHSILNLTLTTCIINEIRTEAANERVALWILGVITPAAVRPVSVPTEGVGTARPRPFQTLVHIW